MSLVRTIYLVVACIDGHERWTHSAWSEYEDAQKAKKICIGSGVVKELSWEIRHLALDPAVFLELMP